MSEDLPVVGVCLSGGYYLHSYKRLLRDLQPLLSLKQKAVVQVDMRRLTFMGPAALATTVATLMRVRDDGLLSATDGYIAWPEAPGIARYLHRMEFLETIFHDREIAGGTAQGHAVGILACQNFTEDAELRAVTKQMLDVIAEKVTLDAVAQMALDTAISEILENVLFHSYTPHGGVAAVQAFKGELELAIVDQGVGIAGSLARNPDYEDQARKDDLTAIRTAMTVNVTSTPERNKGWGLAFTELLLALNEGKLFVRSGRGLVIRGAKQTDKLDSESLPGTLVAMRINLSRPLDYSRAWELLDEAIGRLDSGDVDDGDSDKQRGSRATS